MDKLKLTIKPQALSSMHKKEGEIFVNDSYSPMPRTTKAKVQRRKNLLDY